MANPHNVELEAAKFLQKLIQDSKDEPTKLATKLYVILQHMRASGKENSLPYQVISVAMETVIKQNGLDIEALTSSRLPLVAGTQVGDSGPSQGAAVGSSQRVGVDKDPKSSLTGNELSKPEAYSSGRTIGGPSSSGHDIYQGSPSDMSGIPGAAGKIRGVAAGAASSYTPAETGMSMPMQFACSSFDNQGFAAKMHKDGMESFLAAPTPMELPGGKGIVGKALDHEGGAYILPNSNRLIQGSIPINAPESSAPRPANIRDTGKAPVSDMPFKDHHLKQLRAQCLVFLAFRNGLMPKKTHLEIALGNFFPKEDGPRRDLIEQKGKEQSINDPSRFPEGSRTSGVLDHPRSTDRLPSGTPSIGTHAEAKLLKGSDNSTSMEEEKSQNAALSEHEDRRHHLESQMSSLRGMQSDSNTRFAPVNNREHDAGSNHQQIAMPNQASFLTGPIKQMSPDMSSWMGNGYQTETFKASPTASAMANESLMQRKENAANHCQGPADSQSLGNRRNDSNLHSLQSREQWKSVSAMNGQNNLVMPLKESDVLLRSVIPAQELDMEDEDASVTTERPPFPKYTMSEKWILERQRRKFLNDKMWALKRRKTEQRIAVCSDKLKESVSSSEDIFAKTKSVIELKKLQLLELQRRLRSDILNDFFKPIAPDMDRLKSIKKHRIGRRSKQLERYEQKMKEERQKRIRERQKEFFSEVEVHRERLEDAFKMKRERWKGFNKYVREFHKKKERIHREKIDRIQREKINLLKINDVEGYLRMVQDAKSDRVKQLLKETEKYLQKLGSKLQEAKPMARRFETDMDEDRMTNIFENEIVIENEDETDQAKHYLESNEKYYMMAHSIKESVLEQPTILVGGKLREYQMNGLRWLVSLYNNHLNGILADEMGLGKTVQVISLICYLMETKNDRGPFLVVVPSSVLPGWEAEINFWAPGVHKIVYSGPPEERRRLFKEQIVHQRFNVLLTTYEYLMNKHDRPKLSKVHWHYIIIDEGHRIKNASCKLNADLKHYRSNHRLLLTGTPLQNNLEELWALLNFLLPNIFNSSEDFSQWFNKPFESNVDSSPDEALLSEEENLLIINRLHQVLRPFVLRRLKHKVENELPEKIERLIRCEASAYQKLLMKRVEENLGAIGTSKARSVHNSVMELRNICNHPYLSQLHVEEVHDFIPKHYLPNIVRLCGKLEMLDRLLPKLKASDHRVLLFSTMTRLLDVMEDYLYWKQYKYLRLDGHTSGGDRGALIDKFNQSGSPYFIFLLSIRAGGVGVNLQAADTVIIFDTDWNPQVDLQAQARAHRIGQKKDVLVLRLETVQTVEEQVRAAAEHKLGVANQSITAGFFDNNTSAEDRREYLESLLRECKKEEAAPVLGDDAINYLIARSESEIDVFESVDKRRQEEEMEAWMKYVRGDWTGDYESLPSLPSRLVTDADLKLFYEAMKISEASQQGVAHNTGLKRKGDSTGGLDTQQYGRGKRAREVRSYEEQWTEEEFEKMCQVDSPESPHIKEEIAEKRLATVMNSSVMLTSETQAQLPPPPPPPPPTNPSVEPTPSKEVTPPSKRGRGRPRRTAIATEITPFPGAPSSSRAEVTKAVPKVENISSTQTISVPDSLPASSTAQSTTITVQQLGVYIDHSAQSASLPYVTPQPTSLPCPSTPVQGRGRGRKAQSAGEGPRRRGKRQTIVLQAAPLPAAAPGTMKLDMETQGEAASSSVRAGNPVHISQSSTIRETANPANLVSNVPLPSSSANLVSHVPLSSSPAMSKLDMGSQPGSVSSSSMVPAPDSFPSSSAVPSVGEQDPLVGTAPCSDPLPVLPLPSAISGSLSTSSHPAPKQGRGRGRKAQTGVEAPRRRGKRQISEAPIGSAVLTDQDPKSAEAPQKKARVSVGRKATMRNKQEHDTQKQTSVVQTITSLSIINSAVAQVSEDKPEDEAQKINFHSEASNGIADSQLPPVHGNEQDSTAQRSTDVAEAGTSQSIADPAMIHISESQEDNRAQNQENEAEKRTVQCDALQEIANTPIVQENKGEMDNEGRPKEAVQLDPSQIVAHSSVIKTVENQQPNEAEKQIKGAAQSKADHPVVQVNKDVQVNDAEGLNNITRQDASQSITGPSVFEVWDVKQQNEVKKQNDDSQTGAFETTADPAATEVHKAGVELAATMINETACETLVLEAKDATVTVSGAIVDPIVLDTDRKCISQSSKDGGDEAEEVPGEQYSVPEEGCLSTRITVESASLNIDGSINKSDGLTVERDGNGPEGKETAFEEVVAPKHKSTINQSEDSGYEAGEVPGNEYSVPEEGCVSTQATMETAASTVDGFMNKYDVLAMEQDENGLVGKETAFEEVVAPKHGSTINQSLRDNSNSTSPILEPATTSYSPVSEHENQSGENDAKQQENMDCDVDLPVVSDLELTENQNVTKRDGNAPCLPLSVTASIAEIQDQSSEDTTVVAISSSVLKALACDNDRFEALTGNDDTENVEKVKVSLVDGSLDSLLNEGTTAVAAEHSEERSERESVKLVAQVHEKKECIQSHDPIPVLSTSENVTSVNDPSLVSTNEKVASVNDPALDESEDLFPNGDNSVLLNEDTTPAASELLEERSDSQSEKLVPQEHGKKECVQSHNSISVLSISETLTSVNTLSPDMSEVLCHIGDTKETEKEATFLDEVIVSKPESTMGESLHEISSPTLKTLEQVEQKLDSNIAGDMAAEENPNQQKSKEFSAEESLVPKPQVTLVESNTGKVDADLDSRGNVMEKILCVTPGSVDNQSAEDITSSTCSPFKTETVGVDPALRELKNHAERKFEGGEVEKTSNANEAFIPKPDNLEAETGSSVQFLGTSADLQHDDVEKTSSLQTLSTQDACEEGTGEKFEVESSEKITAEVQEYEIAGVVASVEVASEIFKLPDEAVVSNAENQETADNANAGMTENEAERMDTDMEVDFAVVQTTDLKGGQPEISEVEIGSREEDIEELEGTDGLLRKVSVSGLEVTATQHLEGTISSTFSALGTEDVDAPIPTKESENQSDKETDAGEDGKASKPDEASVPGVEIVAGSERTVEEEAALRSSLIEYEVAPTSVKESENQSDKEPEEGRKACNLDEISIPAPEFCESGSKSTGMDIVAGSGPSVEEAAPSENSVIEDAVAQAPVKESENQSEKETGGEVKEACDPDKTSVPASELSEPGSKSTDVEIVADSEPSVEHEVPLKNSMVDGVVAQALVKESENESDKEIGKGEDKEACNPDETSIPATEACESGSESAGMEIVASSAPSVEEEAPSKNALIEDVVAPAVVKESEDHSEKVTGGGEDKEAGNPDDTLVPATEFCESGSKSVGMEVVAGSGPSVEEEVPLKNTLIKDVVTLTPAKESENLSDKETGGEDKEACNPGEASVLATEFCESGSKSSAMETVAGSGPSVEKEAPLKNSLIEDVVNLAPAKESENQSDKETGEREDEICCKPDEASVKALREPGSKSSGMEIEPSSEQCVEVEAPLDKSLIEDVVDPTPITECEHQSDNETEAGDGNSSNPNKASVPAPDFCVSESKSPGMETAAGSEQRVGEEAPAAAEVVREKSGNESNLVSAAEVHDSANAELDKQEVLVAEINEVQPTVNTGTSEEHTDKEQLGGDNSKTATDSDVASSASQTTDMKDELPSSLDNSSKASEIHENLSSAAGMDVCSVPTVNEVEDMQTE